MPDDVPVTESSERKRCSTSTIELPAEVRLRRRGDLTFAFHYGENALARPFSDEPLLGEPEVIPRNFTVWRSRRVYRRSEGA